MDTFFHTLGVVTSFTGFGYVMTGIGTVAGAVSGIGVLAAAVGAGVFAVGVLQQIDRMSSQED
jgi:hypothetical protein